MIVRMLIVSAAVSSALLMHGCATTSGENEADATQTREYRTGSNLPSRDYSRVRTTDRDGVEAMRSVVAPTGPIRSGN
jgi:outer membrane murein-binding lipoprotein Lpp